MGSGASSATPCLAGFFALRCFSLITIWVTPESWAVKLITSLPHWFYTRILRVPKCFPAVGPSLDANSLHNSGDTHRPSHGRSWLNRRKQKANPIWEMARNCLAASLDDIVDTSRFHLGPTHLRGG